MLDLPLPILPTTGARGVPPGCPSGNIRSQSSVRADPVAPRAGRSDVGPGRAPSARPIRDAGRCRCWARSDHAEGMATNTAPQLLAIFDRDERLVLAGAASDCAVAWCHPVMSATEARGVVTEASQLRAQAGPRGNLG